MQRVTQSHIVLLFGSFNRLICCRMLAEKPAAALGVLDALCESLGYRKRHYANVDSVNIRRSFNV